MKIKMKTKLAKGMIILKQTKGGSTIMSASQRSPYFKKLKLKDGKIVTITIK